MLNVFIDILKNIRKNGLSNNNHLYITFLTNHKKVKLAKWIKQKYPNEMTIVIQYEYNNLEVNEDNFSITLSFNDIKTKLIIDYDSILSFADPSANFGLILKQNTIQKKANLNVKEKLKNDQSEKNNVIDFSIYKKN